MNHQTEAYLLPLNHHSTETMLASIRENPHMTAEELALTAHHINKRSYSSILEIASHPNASDTLIAFITAITAADADLYSSPENSATDTLTTLLALPHAGGRTIRAFHDGWLYRTIRNYDPQADQDLHRHMLTDPSYPKYENKLLQLSTEEYCDATIAAQIALAAATLNSETANKAVENATTKVRHIINITDQNSSPENRKTAETLKENTQKALQTTRELANQQSENLTAVLTLAHTLTTNYSIIASESITNTIIRKVAGNKENILKLTLTSLKKLARDMNDTEAGNLSGSPQLPAEYQKKLIALKMENLIQKLAY